MKHLMRWASTALFLLCSQAALANFHTFVVDQVFTNSSGSIQFVVMREALSANGQEFWVGHSLTSSISAYPFPTNLPSGNTAGRRVLVGTQSFAALGIVAPDYVVPDNFLAIDGGYVDFGGVSRLNYTQLPTDGVNALYANGNVAPNMATNFAGASQSVTVPAPINYTALWWNPAESGWGININHQGDILFATLFTYEATGSVMWLVMSNGARLINGTSFSGLLYRTTGSPFNANPFPPIGPSNITEVGTMSLAFSGENNGMLTYTVNGASVTKMIQRQVYGARAANCVSATGSRTGLTNYQDLWWIPVESGWGVNVTHQDNTLFATLFT